MFIFVILVLGPAIGFMIYALAQFRREEIRLRPRPASKLPWGVTPASEPDPLDQENPRRVWSSTARRAIPANDLAVLQFAPGVASPVREKVVAACIKSRVIVLPSHVERPAMKRAAKGSS